MKRKEYNVDTISIKSEMKKRSRQINKRCRMERTLIRHGSWVNQY